MKKIIPEWIWEEENRKVAAFLGAAVVAVATAVWTVVIYYNGRTPADVRPVSQVKTSGAPGESYRVCKGDTMEKCMPVSVFVGCSEIENFAKLTCGEHYRLVPINAFAGGKCGYEWTQVTCEGS
jgi:hypothetical protein